MRFLLAIRRIVPLALIVLIAACSSPGTREEGSAPVDSAPGHTQPRPPATPAQPGGASTQPNASAAYQPLLDRARRASDSGDYDGALALLERAQRIDPDSAEIYLDLARTHSAHGDPAQARAVAERGLLYCSGRSQCDALRAFTR